MKIYYWLASVFYHEIVYFVRTLFSHKSFQLIFECEYFYKYISGNEIAHYRAVEQSSGRSFSL